VYSSILSSTSALDWALVNATLRPLYPRKDPVSIVEEVGWAPGTVWMARKISPPPGFDPRTVQPVASRYID